MDSQRNESQTKGSVEESTGTFSMEWKDKETVGLRLSGRLDNHVVGRIWRELHRQLSPAKLKKITVDASEVSYCDGAGFGLLFRLQLQARQNNFDLQINNLSEQFSEMLAMYDADQFAECAPPKRRKMYMPEEIGQAAIHITKDIRNQIAFLGELVVALFRQMITGKGLRWSDAFYVAETSGVNAVGIIVLIGFLFGLIMAYMGVITLQKFGGEIYVANMVAVAMVRVLGPFITAVMLSGRSGSAYAAELGTMKINEEIDALNCMGLDAMSFLVVPRVLAITIMTPLLSALANLAALAGSAVVLLSMGIPLAAYTQRVTGAVDLADLFGGLFKATVYGFIIGAIGCMRGIQTRSGSSAVGDSATQAVVSSIVLIVIAEGIFAVLFHQLGI